MPTESEPYTTYDRGWMVRVRQPVDPTNPRMLLLLHGWTGDETVMWVFTRNLPGNYWILSPRGPVQAPEKGYGWLPNHGILPTLQDFKPVAQSLIQAVQHWQSDLRIPAQPFSVMGFSQGAAMAYALAAFYPQSVNQVIALAGFLPQDDPMPGHYSGLNGKKVYIAHGTQDDTVPVTLAREAVQTLQAVGADVSYCESEVGHKLSLSCLKGLDHFME